MAGNDLGKLWFEMGVRDKVTGAMQAAVREAQRLGKAIDDIADKNANNLTRALYRIAETAQRTMGAIRQGNALGLDTSKLREGLRQMLAVRRQLLNLQKDGSLAMSTKPLNKLLGAEFEHMMVTMRGATIAQENLNKAQARSNTRAAAQAEREHTQATQARIRAQEQLLRTYDRVTAAMQRQGQAASQLKNVMSDYFSVYAGMNLVRELITVGGEFEVQKVALQTILGDMREGEEIYSQIQALAVESPMSFRQLAGYTKQLAAFNIPYEELYDTTKRLADISAGVGVDMGRLILAYGQVRSATVLRGTELRQFTEAGIPMVEALAKKFNELNGTMVTSADVLNKLIPTKQIPFEMVRDVLKDMTDEGGRFYNMQMVLADTLAGKWSNLRDAWEVMLAGIANGETLTGRMLKGAVSGVTELTKAMDTLLPVIAAVGLGFGAKRAKRWAGDRLGMNTRNVTQGMLTAKETARQAALQKQLLQGSQALTVQERQLLSAKMEVTAADYRRLAVSGRLSTMQLASLYRQRMINASTIQYLAQQRIITAEQQKQIVQATTRLRLLRMQSAEMAKQAGRAVGGALVGMLRDPFTWITAALAGGMAIWQHYEQVSQQAANAADSLVQRAEQTRETVNSLLDGGKPSDNSKLAERIREMTEALRGVVPNYNEIKEQADAIEDLGDRYDYLAEKLKETAAAYKALTAESTKGLIEDMTHAAGGGIGGFFSGNAEGLGADMEDFDDAVRELQKSAVHINKYVADEVMAAVDKIAAGNEKLKKALEGKEGMTEILRTFFENTTGSQQKELQRLVPSVIDYRTNFIEMRKQLEEMYRDMDGAIQEFIDQKSAEGWNFKHLNDGQKEQAQQVIDAFVNSYEGASKEAKRLVEQYGLDKLNIKVNVDFDTNDAEKELSDFANQVWQGFGGNLTKEGGTISIGKQKYTKENIAKNFTDASSTRKRMKQEVQDAYQEWKDIEKVSVASQEAKDRARKAYEDALSAYNAMGWTDNPLNKTNKANKKDAWLEQMKARMSLLPKYISLYEKYRDTMGADAAREKVNADVQFASLRAIGITDPTDEVGAWKTIVEQMNKAKTTAERRKAAEDALAKLYDAQADAIVRQNRVLNEQATQALEKLNRQWEMYRKWLEATGSAEVAGTVAFGGRTAYGNEAEELREEVERLLEERAGRTGSAGSSGTDRAYTVEDVLGMTGTELDEAFGKAGQGAEALREKIDALKEAQRKLNEETLNGLLEMIEASKGYDAQIADVDRRLEKQLELIGKTTFNNDAETNERIREQYGKAAREAADRERSGILFKQFQEESDWVTIFDDLDRVSTATITDMIDRIAEFSKTAGLSVEEVKRLRDALAKLRDEALARNPFGGIVESLNRANAIREFLERAGRTGSAGRDGKIRVSKEQGARMGLQAGEYTRAQLEGKLRGAEADTVRSIENIGKAFDGLQGALDPVIELFDTLGADTGGLGDVLGTISGALGTASGTGGQLQNLMGMSVGKDKSLGEALGIKNAGLWGAAAGAALSVTTSIFALHDKALQKEIEASEARQKEMENLTKNVQTVLERTMGGVYRYRASEADLKDFEKYVREPTDFERRLGINNYGYIQEGTREQIREAEKSRSYYDTYLASLMVQRDELAHQMDAERDKKKSDKNAIADMKQEIAELDDQIRYVAEDMANELYGVDFKSWAADLSQTLADAWASGTDAAEAYRDKVSDILRDVGVNVITQKYLEPLLEEQMEKFMDYFEANNGVIDAPGMEILSGMYDLGDKAQEVVDAYLDGLEAVANERGETLKDTGSASSSVIGGSVSEDEVGLGLAYLNSIRADTATMRTYLQRMAEETEPIANVLAQHTATLKAIEANTGRGAEAAEAVRDMLNSVANGTRKLNVVTWVKKS